MKKKGKKTEYLQNNNYLCKDEPEDDYHYRTHRIGED